MIPRRLTARIRDRFRKYPIVTITGPRQSGKSTLCRLAFPKLPYVSLEAQDVRDEALSDPRRFLGRYHEGAILDEAQRAPELFSYLQVICDERGTNGQFVLTGSQNFQLLSNLSQSLAGRTAIFHLLPPSLDELREFPAAPTDLDTILVTGAYPRIHDQRLDAYEWLGEYVQTYVERDVRQIINVGDLLAFQTFVRLCAGRSGQVLNLQSLGSDAGIDGKTAKAWLSILETSFLVMRVPPLLPNLNKRLIKAPKLIFLDTGLLCRLLGIRTKEQLESHPLRGPIFETWVITEVLKARFNTGAANDLYFYRDHAGNEVDLVLAEGGGFTAVEIKAGTTIAGDFFRGLERFRDLIPKRAAPGGIQSVLVYGGDREQHHGDTRVLPWSRIQDYPWADSS